MKIGILFPGYGNQFVGMGKELYNEVRLIQEYFEQASHCLNNNFVQLCFASSDVELRKLCNAYPSLFLVSLSIIEYIKSLGITPDIVAGHGVGEYAAISSVKGLSFPDGLYLLNKLALFYTAVQETLQFKSVMILNTTQEDIDNVYTLYKQKHSDDRIYIAVQENDSTFIVSGPEAGMDEFVKIARRKRIGKVKKYKFSSGLHTPALQDLEKKLRIYLTKVDFKDVCVPVVSNVDVKQKVKAQEIEDALMSQVSSRLYWHDVLKSFSDVDVLIIPAPNKVFYKEVASYYPDKHIVPINTLDDVEKLKSLVL